MTWYGDGREERADAMLLEIRLKKSKKLAEGHARYNAAVSAAREHAAKIGNDACISKLMAHNQAYIEDLLRTEDERFGAGAIAERFARTFWEEFAT